MEASNRKNIAILAFALIVVMLGYGMVIPLFPFYIAEMGAGEVSRDVTSRLITKSPPGLPSRPTRP